MKKCVKESKCSRITRAFKMQDLCAGEVGNLANMISNLTRNPVLSEEIMRFIIVQDWISKQRVARLKSVYGDTPTAS